MGLDSYLSKYIYLADRLWGKEDGTRALDALTEAGFDMAIPPDRLRGSGVSLSLQVKVGYWRKSNQIHGWFVRELAGGVDERQDIDVSRRDLIALRDACGTVLLSRGTDEEEATVTEHLEPTPGFFFGSTEVDEGYWLDLEYTRNLLTWLIDHSTDADSWIYRASW